MTIDSAEFTAAAAAAADSATDLTLITVDGVRYRASIVDPDRSTGLTTIDLH